MAKSVNIEMKVITFSPDKILAAAQVGGMNVRGDLANNEVDAVRYLLTKIAANDTDSILGLSLLLNGTTMSEVLELEEGDK